MKAAINIALAGLLTLGGATLATADEFPSKPVRLVVPYPAGGVTDLVARVVADGLKSSLNQTIIVDNKPGAAGVIGTQDVLRSKADGYTLLVGGLGGLITPPLTNPKFPIDVDKSLVPVAGIAEFTNVMVVNADLPVKTVAEFIAYAKQRPGQLNYGSSGVAATNHLTAEFFQQATGTKMVHVPYKGGPAALNDLRGGAIQVIFENIPEAIGQIRAGTVRALAVTSPYRVPQLPDVPTMQEAGLPNFAVTSWMGIYAPAGVPAPILDRLGKALVAAAEDASSKERLQKIGFAPVTRDTPTFQAFNKSESARWKTVIDTAGIQVNE